MAFRVGMKVVCVRDDFLSRNKEILPALDVVYTIRAIFDGKFGLYFHLAEIVNAVIHYDDGTFECTFDARAFRPVVTRSTDTGMAILRKLLNTKERENVLCGNE